MNRNSEWNDYVCSIRSDVPPQIDYCAQRAVRRAKKRKLIFVKLPAAGVFMSLVLFVTLANTSRGFSKSIGGSPLLSKLAKLVTANPALRAAVATAERS